MTASQEPTTRAARDTLTTQAARDTLTTQAARDTLTTQAARDTPTTQAARDTPSVRAARDTVTARAAQGTTTPGTGTTRGSGRTGMWRGQSPAQRSAVRRQQLLAAGLEVFGTCGWQQSTVRGICAAAGLSERYFYESFASRDELLLAVYEDLNEREFAMFSQAARQRLDDIASPDGQTLMSVLHDALLAWFATFKADPRVARVRLIEVLGVSAQIDERYRAHNRRIADSHQGSERPLRARGPG